MADLRDRIRQRLDGGESEPDLRSRIRSRLSGGGIRRSGLQAVSPIEEQAAKAFAFGALDVSSGAVKGSAIQAADVVGRVGAGASGLASLATPAAIGRLPSQTGRQVLPEFGGQLIESGGDMRQAIVQKGQEWGAAVDRVAAGLGYQRSPGIQGLGEDVIGAIPQLLGAAGAGAAASTVAGPIAGMTAAAGVFAATDAGSQTARIYEETGDLERSAAAGRIYGLASGALEYVGIGAAVRRTGMLKALGRAAESRVGRTIGAGAVEGFTEAAQGVVGDAANAWAAKDWPEFQRTWNDLDTRGREFLVGALLGTAVRGGVEALAPDQYESAAEMLADIEVVPNAGSPEVGPSQAPGNGSATSQPGTVSQTTPEGEIASPQHTPTVSIRLRGVGAPQPDSRLGDGTPVFKGRAAAEEYVRFKNERRIPGDPILRATPGEGGMVVVPDTRLDERRAEIGTADQEWSRAERLMRQQVSGAWQARSGSPRGDAATGTPFASPLPAESGTSAAGATAPTVPLPTPSTLPEPPATEPPPVRSEQAGTAAQEVPISPSASQPPSPESIAPSELASPPAGGESVASVPVESMTRPQLLAEAARLGVLEGVKTAPKLRERVAAARGGTALPAESPESVLPQAQSGVPTGTPSRSRPAPQEAGTPGIGVSETGDATTSVSESRPSPQSTPAAEQGKKPLVPREQDMMLEASEMTAAERRAQSAWIRATFGAELATPLASEGGISPAQIGQMRKKEHARWQANAQKRMGLESRLRDLARTDEDLRAESAREVEKKNASRVTQLESMVQTWKNVGKGKTGKIRPTYQKLIDEAEAEITSLQPPPPAQQQDLVLWGRRAGEPWVKLGDNTSRAEMVRREKDGWEVLRYPKGESPEMPAQQQERQAEAPVAETVGVEMRPVKNKPIPRSAKFVGEFRKGDANDYVGQLWKLADGTYRVYDQMNMKATKESRPLAANELERSGGMNLSASQSVRFFRLRGTPAEAKTPRAPSAPDRGVFGQIAASPMTAGQMVMPQVKYKDTESAAPTTFTPTGDEVDTEIREKFDEADVPALPFGDVQDTAEGVANPQKGIEQTFSKAEVRKILDAEFGGVTRPGNKGKVARPQGEGLVESTAQGMVSDYLRLLGRVYGMDARGELMREDTGALVGLDSSKLNVGDRFTLDHESVEVVEADDQAVTVRIGDGEHEIKLRGDVAISGIPVEDVYGVQRGKLIPANKGSLVQGKPSKKKGTGRIRDIANRMEAEARAANAKLNIPRGRNIGATLPPAYYANLVKIMAAKILRGAARFADVAAEMVKSEGDWIEEHLRDIWNDADRLASEISEGTEVENPTTARVVQRVEQRRKAESEATSARMVDMDEDRANLGLDALDSPARRSWQDALDTADARGLSEIHRALQLSAEVINTPRAYSDIETAGLVKAAADLKSQHRALLAAISVTKDAAELAGKAAELHGLEDQFDTISTALRKSGTEKGRALASQKLALDSDMSLIAVKARAKAAKGAELTAEESAKIEELTTALEAANTKAAELEAKLKTKTAEAALRKNQESKPKRPKPTREAEFASKLARAKELLSMGCR